MKFLERSRPAQDAYLIVQAMLTRLSVGEPYVTRQILEEATQTLRHAKQGLWEVRLLNASAGEVALMEVEVAVPDDLPVEMLLIYLTLLYGKAVSEHMFGEQALRSAETWVSCKGIKAYWKGTTEWEMIKLAEEEEDRSLPNKVVLN